MQNEDNKQWAERRLEVKAMRDKRRGQFSDVVRSLQDKGFDVEEITPFQYRINGVLDVYPSNKRFHDLSTQKRGDIRGVSYEQFILAHFGIKTATV